jgi:protease-4
MFNKDANSSKSGSSDESWNRDLVNRLAFAAVDEQRRARRWSVFFKFLLALYLLALLILYMPTDWSELSRTSTRHTALVDLKGVISDSSDASADKIISGLRDAFEDENTAGVILRANSPGGSPVQSAYIYDEINRLKGLYPDTPLYAVVTDVCASGCYYVVSAADDIYVNNSSIIGSIGVRMDSFGFVDTLEKLGVERRLYTAGDSKGFLDPFTPSKPADVAHVKLLLESIHEQFIDAVKTGRGERLKDHQQLFTGLVWTGEESLPMGLADQVGSSGYVAREVIGEEEIIEFTEKPDLLEKLTERVGVSMAKGMSELFASGASSIR